MRKKCLFGTSGAALLFIVMALFAGCTTTHHYEKDAPVETQATLRWVGKEIKTVALDEAGANWKIKSFLFGSFSQCIVCLPPGPHILTVNYKSNFGRMDALHIGANFKAGSAYVLSAMPGGKGVTLGITEAAGR